MYPGGTYPGQDDGQIVNGGAYAYVIHEDVPAAPPSSPKGTPSTGQTAELRAITVGLDEAAATTATATPPAPDAARPAGITTSDEAIAPAGATPPAGATAPAGGTAAAAAATAPAAPDLVSDVAPEDMYGPDDPAYGPPPPGWRKRDRDDEPRAAESPAPVDLEAEQSSVRGPFEPLRSEDRLPGDLPSADPWPEDWAGYGAADFGAAGHDDASRLADRQADGSPSGDGYPDAGRNASAGDLAAGDHLEATEEPEPLDFGAPSDPEAGRLGDLRDLYTMAEEIGPARLDRHFDELLDRQRKLISEYFAEPGPSAQLDSFPSVLPFGFDSAETLATLRGDLRGAPS